jgi:tRNA threonylcarbamoyladenosine biosynthesis protein TsaB
MHSYIAIQNTYDVFEIALFINHKLACPSKPCLPFEALAEEGRSRVDKKREDKHNTSKLFIPILDELLTKNSAKISDFDFCAVNCGPGPFSTLRSIIASVNGLHFATNIPLIGIDGLEATFLEFYDNTYEHTVVLLNAFNNEVYYLIAHRDQILTKGYQKIDLFLQKIKHEIPAPLNFIGNGATLHQALIQETLGNNVVIKELNPSMCSIEIIARLGLKKWLLKQGTTDLSDEALAKSGFVMPLHLKKHAVEL